MSRDTFPRGNRQAGTHRQGHLGRVPQPDPLPALPLLRQRRRVAERRHRQQVRQRALHLRRRQLLARARRDQVAFGREAVAGHVERGVGREPQRRHHHA